MQKTTLSPPSISPNIEKEVFKCKFSQSYKKHFYTTVGWINESIGVTEYYCYNSGSNPWLYKARAGIGTIKYWCQKKDPTALWVYGRILIGIDPRWQIESDLKKGVGFLTEAAKAGNNLAQYDLGRLYDKGLEGFNRDEGQALMWYTLAAEKNNALAQFKLGWIYREGWFGVEKNEEEAHRCFTKAADAGLISAKEEFLLAAANDGNSEAQFQLAKKYWHRQLLSFALTDERAMELCLQAAERDHAPAQYLLGYMYECNQSSALTTYHGEKKTTTPNLIAATKWYRRAAEQQNHAQAQNRLKEIIGSLTNPLDSYFSKREIDVINAVINFEMASVQAYIKEGKQLNQIKIRHDLLLSDLASLMGNEDFSQTMKQLEDNIIPYKAFKSMLEMLYSDLNQNKLKILDLVATAERWDIAPLTLTFNDIKHLLWELTTRQHEIIEEINLDGILLGEEGYSLLLRLFKLSPSLQKVSILRTGLDELQMVTLQSLAESKMPPINLNVFSSHNLGISESSQALAVASAVETENFLPCSEGGFLSTAKISDDFSKTELPLSMDFIEEIQCRHSLASDGSEEIIRFIQEQKEFLANLDEDIRYFIDRLDGWGDKIAVLEKKLSLDVHSNDLEERICLLEKAISQIQSSINREKDFFTWCKDRSVPFIQGERLYLCITHFLYATIKAAELSQTGVFKVHTGIPGIMADVASKGIAGVGSITSSVLSALPMVGILGAPIAASCIILGVVSNKITDAVLESQQSKKLNRISTLFRHGIHQIEIVQEIAITLAKIFRNQLELLDVADIEKIASVVVMRLFGRILDKNTAQDFSFWQKAESSQLDIPSLIDTLVLEICSNRESTLLKTLKEEKIIQNLFTKNINTIEKKPRKWVIAHIFTHAGLEVSKGQEILHYCKQDMQDTFVRGIRGYLFRFPICQEEEDYPEKFNWALIGKKVLSSENQLLLEDKKGSTPMLSRIPVGAQMTEIAHHRFQQEIIDLKQEISHLQKTVQNHDNKFKQMKEENSKLKELVNLLLMKGGIDESSLKKEGKTAYSSIKKETAVPLEARRLYSFWQEPNSASLLSHPLCDDEENLNIAALNSQRTIKAIKIMGQVKECLVVGATPDGDCGFTAIRQSLIIQGYEELAKSFYREKFIKLVGQIYNRSDPSNDLYRPYIEDIFKVDKISNYTEWEERFKSSSCWLEEAHFKFLSFSFDINFNFYGLLPDSLENTFESVPAYESIQEKPSMRNKIISLTYVKTKLNSHLNHFDTIIVEPTETLEELENKLKQFEEKILSLDYSSKLM